MQLVRKFRGLLWNSQEFLKILELLIRTLDVRIARKPRRMRSLVWTSWTVTSLKISYLCISAFLHRWPKKPSRFMRSRARTSLSGFRRYWPIRRDNLLKPLEKHQYPKNPLTGERTNKKHYRNKKLITRARLHHHINLQFFASRNAKTRAEGLRQILPTSNASSAHMHHFTFSYICFYFVFFAHHGLMSLYLLYFQ